MTDRTKLIFTEATLLEVQRLATIGKLIALLDTKVIIDTVSYGIYMEWIDIGLSRDYLFNTMMPRRDICHFVDGVFR